MPLGRGRKQTSRDKDSSIPLGLFSGCCSHSFLAARAFGHGIRPPQNTSALLVSHINRAANGAGWATVGSRSFAEKEIRSYSGLHDVRAGPLASSNPASHRHDSLHRPKRQGECFLRSVDAAALAAVHGLLPRKTRAAYLKKVLTAERLFLFGSRQLL